MRSGLTRVHCTLDGSARSIDGQPPFSAGSCSGYWVNRQELAVNRRERALWANALSRRRRSDSTEPRPTGSPTNGSVVRYTCSNAAGRDLRVGNDALALPAQRRPPFRTEPLKR